MENKVAVIGKDGQLGRALQSIRPDCSYFDRENVDLSSLESINAFDWSKYNTVINAAAYTAVDKAEEEPELAHMINATAVGIISERLSRNGGSLIHFSTDYIFDGTKDLHDETETPNPKSIYGETKYQGEILALANPKTYVVRTSWVIGDGNNFARTMLKLASSGVNPNVVNDQFGRPTLASLLAKFAIHLCDTSPEYSTYNLSNEGPTVSWCDLAKTIFEMSGNDPGRVSGLSTEDYFKDKAHANRPKNSTFSLEKAKSTGFEIPEWKEDLKKYIDEELKK